MPNTMDPVLNDQAAQERKPTTGRQRLHHSLICYPSKVMLNIILNRLRSQAEAIIAEEQAGLRAEYNTTEQIFNLRILCEVYPQHQ